MRGSVRRTRRTARSGQRQRDSGAAALELLLLFPSVLLTVLAALSAGLWFHARNVALSAAQEGVRVARSHDNPGNGAQAARDFATESGDGILQKPNVTVGGDLNTISITVKGRAVSMIPGLDLDISQTARAPRERFTADGDQ